MKGWRSTNTIWAKINVDKEKNCMVPSTIFFFSARSPLFARCETSLYHRNLLRNKYYLLLEAGSCSMVFKSRAFVFAGAHTSILISEWQIHVACSNKSGAPTIIEGYRSISFLLCWCYYSFCCRCCLYSYCILWWKNLCTRFKYLFCRRRVSGNELDAPRLYRDREAIAMLCKHICDTNTKCDKNKCTVYARHQNRSLVCFTVGFHRRCMKARLNSECILPYHAIP